MDKNGAAIDLHDWETWEDDDLRRSVSYLTSGNEHLYVSTYVATRPRQSTVLLICPVWSAEARIAAEARHDLALGMARLGGGAVIFDYPGHGESTGEPEAATFPRLLDAVLEVARELGPAYPGTWVPVGIGLGAAVAFTVAERVGGDRILLFQPALDPQAYFADLLRRGARGRLRGDAADRSGVVMGVPVSEEVLRAAETAVPQVRAAVAAFAGTGLCVRYARPAPVPGAPAGLEEIVVEGTWGLQHGLDDLVPSALGWLEASRW